MVSGIRSKWLKAANILGFIITIGMNILANALPLNGRTTGEISSLYPNLFTPAPLTFSIWGLIFFLLLLFTGYQTFAKRPKDLEYIDRIGLLFLINSVAIALWLVFWHYLLIFLSTAAMLVILITLIAIYLQIRKVRNPNGAQKLFFLAPFSIYLGWISVATIANITVLLVSIGWNGFGIAPQVWTSLVIAVAAILALIFLFKYRDVLYALVIIWALAGIILRHLTEFKGQYPAVIASAAAGIVVILAGIVYIAISRKRV